MKAITKLVLAILCLMACSMCIAQEQCPPPPPVEKSDTIRIQLPMSLDLTIRHRDMSQNTYTFQNPTLIPEEMIKGIDMENPTEEDMKILKKILIIAKYGGVAISPPASEDSLPDFDLYTEEYFSDSLIQINERKFDFNN